MRTLVALLLLGAVGWGQAKESDSVKAAKAFSKIVLELRHDINETQACNRELRKTLEACMDTVKLAADAVQQCTVEVDKPHLPLTVNPGECYRIGGDMSMHLIECP